MQGHALFVRQAGGALPCPQVDFTGGFNGFLAAAYNLGNRSVEDAFGSPFDPFMNDQNFVLSVLTLEEFGATGNKVSAPKLSLCGKVRSNKNVNGVASVVMRAMLCSVLQSRFHAMLSFRCCLFAVYLCIRSCAFPTCFPPVCCLFRLAHFHLQLFLRQIMLSCAVAM